MAIPTNLSVAAVSYNGTGIPLVGIVPSGTTQVNVTQNGTTTQDVTNYATLQVIASVPNSYSAGDEGKVVNNGSLYTQGSSSVTTNDTYDTTLISSLTVNVSGGGGNSGLLTPIHYDMTGGYVNGSSWVVSSDPCYSDVFQVVSGHHYLIFLGGVVGNRFRALFTTVDTNSGTNLSGVSIINSTSPGQYQSTSYHPVSDGYITVTKCNNNVSGLKSYVLEIEAIE